MELQTLTVARGDRAFLQIVPAVVSEMDGRDLRAWFGRGYATISETFRSPMPEESIRAGVLDFMGANTVDADGHGVVIGVALSTTSRVSNRRRPGWSQMMTHLGAAHRLRRRLARLNEEPDAVFVDGRAEHLHDELKDREPSRVLRRAVLARETAMNSSDGKCTLDVWRGLVSGRWSLVDVFESDGKRYVAAYQNQLEPPFTLALSRRQREVAELVGRGLTNGQIAYRLGLTESSVASHLQGARHALGVRSTTELVNVYRTLNHSRRTRQLLDEVHVVRIAGIERRPNLTAAELSVCELVGRGLSNQQIGQARNVSVRTVANQVASVLEKLGLRSRREIALL